jgi:hypothetical protein
MLQLVGPDWVGDAASEPQGDAEPEPSRASDGDLRRLASELLVQLPARPDEALAVVEHLAFLARWRAGMVEEIRATERATAHATECVGPPLLMLLTCSSQEARLADYGFKDAANTYAALMLRRGFLGAGFCKA